MTHESLLAADRHLLHPLHHPDDHTTPLMFVEGRGCTLLTAEGRAYLDAFSGLWNVLVGYGRAELAHAAAAQMKKLAYCSSYIGSSNEPAALLAERLSHLTYPQLNFTYFVCGGAEANETAFKVARCYWKLQGKPTKTKVIARWHGYHGCTAAAMSATGMPPFWKMFEPRMPGFLHVPPPYPYRFEGARAGESVGAAAARMLEEMILDEGADTVAAFIAEPVIGSGGVIVPPDDYFPLVREVCDRHEVLFIADEVITGFGRTGKWFALDHWKVQPDLMSFAKGITSGYVPLGGVCISDVIRDAFNSARSEDRFMHATTYAAHPTCCAVALANLDLIERDCLVARAGEFGSQLLSALHCLNDLDCVGEVRGFGLMAAVELVGDRASKSPANMGQQVARRARESGLIVRARGDIVMIAPPLIVTADQIARIVSTLRNAIVTVRSEAG